MVEADLSYGKTTFAVTKFRSKSFKEILAVKVDELTLNLQNWETFVNVFYSTKSANCML